MGTIAHFFITHNGTIFGVTATLTCVLGIVIVYLNVFKRNKIVSDEKPDFDFSQIEASLKKILSQTHTTIQAVNADPAAVVAAGGIAPAEVATLKKELEDRVKLIEELKTQVAQAKADDGSAGLLAKIKTLEGKLAEYEIIEDDIADLSHFKEENTRLKREIDAIKRGGPELVDQFAAAVGGAPAPAAATPAPEAPTPAAAPQAPAPAAPVANASDSALADIVAQAQSTAEVITGALEEPAAEAEAEETLEFGPGGEAPAAPSAGTAPGATAAAGGAAPANTPTNIFAEFAGDGTEQKDPLAELGEIDTNRMLEELKDLNMDMNVGAEALDEDPDIDKLAHEAQHLEKKGS